MLQDYFWSHVFFFFIPLNKKLPQWHKNTRNQATISKGCKKTTQTQVLLLEKCISWRTRPSSQPCLGHSDSMFTAVSFENRTLYFTWPLVDSCNSCSWSKTTLTVAEQEPLWPLQTTRPEPAESLSPVQIKDSRQRCELARLGSTRAVWRCRLWLAPNQEASGLF